MKISKNTSKSHEDLALLDRNKCFSLVATAVNDVVTDSVVDLKSPEVKTRKPFRNSIMYRFLLIFIAAFLLIKLNVTVVSSCGTATHLWVTQGGISGCRLSSSMQPCYH